jgi:hypothetical protein
MLNPVKPPGGEDWWTGQDCASYIQVTEDTWRYYWSRERPKDNPAPKPTRYFGVTPVWDPAVVRAWHAARPGRGWWRRKVDTPI